MKLFYIFDEHSVGWEDKSFVVQDSEGYYLANPRNGSRSLAIGHAMICSKRQTLENEIAKAVPNSPYFGFKIVPIRIVTFREPADAPRREPLKGIPSN